MANSTSGNDCFAAGRHPDRLGYNLDDDGTCGFTGGTGDLSDTPSGLDPTGLHANGGPTDTIALEPGSAAIDAVADPSLCPATDQRGSTEALPATSAPTTPTCHPPSRVAFGGTSELPDRSPCPDRDSAPSPTSAHRRRPAADWSGSDLCGTDFALSDNGWSAGETGDCIGVNICPTRTPDRLHAGFGVQPGRLLRPADRSATALRMTVVGPPSTEPSRSGPAPPYALITDPGPNTVSQIDTTTGDGGQLLPVQSGRGR